MLDFLIEAINSKKVLSFHYDGLRRVVEPHAVGQSTAGNDVLRCFQTEGEHIKPGHEWDFCCLSKIRNLAATGATFAGPRPQYRRGDKHMRVIYAQL
ncbi:hypothetical protein NOV72_00862 [Caballeronia novacaledonica]|uniref:WYL domain-containing protein n=1 Tax=Caballeronia novacaledonica TaxID=1544861 RepID=A0A2U3I0H1_9BURK|nr:hypothetical protein NOV72_00862 [Caballeronia novacaledonica]